MSPSSAPTLGASGPVAEGRRPLRATWLGRRAYVDAWRLQEAVAARVRRGEAERLLMLEHDPVYTIGRRGDVANLGALPRELAEAGATVYRVDRGGDVTYHGPGQLVGYPILSLGDAPDLVAFVRGLESGLIAAVAAYGVRARTERGKTGVWVDLSEGRPAKLAAIGVRVSRGVTTHGFALNVTTDLAAFKRMVPCGFAHEVASLESLGVRAGVREVASVVAPVLADALGLALVWEDAVAEPVDGEIPDDAPVIAARDLLAEELVAVS